MPTASDITSREINRAATSHRLRTHNVIVMVYNLDEKYFYRFAVFCNNSTTSTFHYFSKGFLSGAGSRTATSGMYDIDFMKPIEQFIALPPKL